MITDVIADLAGALAVLPSGHPRAALLALVLEAVRRDAAFIDRHRSDYPQALFQCLWNRGWWYDAPAAERHFEEPAAGWAAAPWRADGPKLSGLVEQWRAAREALIPGFQWARSLRPPLPPLGSAALRVCRGHQRVACALCFSPDGRQLASGSYDGTVRIWNTADGSGQAVLDTQSRGVYGVAFSPDGRTVATGSVDGVVRFWDASGQLIRAVKGHSEPVGCVAYSADGELLASAGYDNTVRVWSSTGRPAVALYGWDLPESDFDSVAFSADAARVAAGARDGSVWVWEVATGKRVTRAQAHPEGVGGLVNSVAFLADGRVRSACHDGTVALTDPDTESVVERWDAGCRTGCSTKLCGADVLLVGTGVGQVSVWPPSGGAPRATVSWHGVGIRSVAMSPDGRLLAAGDAQGTVRVWDADCPPPDLQPLGHGPGGTVTCLAPSPNGRWVVTGGPDGTVQVWDTGSAHRVGVLAGHEGGVLCVAVSRDSRRIVSGGRDGTVRVWELPGGPALCVLQGHTRDVSRVQFSPDGAKVWSYSGDDHASYSWDPGTGAREENPDQSNRAGGRGESWHWRSPNFAHRGAWNARAQGNETELEELDELCTCWYPEPLQQLAISRHRVWAGVAGRDLVFVEVEGELLPEDDD